MSLLIVSGMPSPGKKQLFLSLVEGIVRIKGINTENNQNKTVVVVQNDVSVRMQEEVSRVKAAVQHGLGNGSDVLVYAPMHVKSLRYEVMSSIARNSEQGVAHVYYEGMYEPGGEIEGKEVQEISRSVVFVGVTGFREKESYKTVQEIFEIPRGRDKWDAPCFICTSPGQSEYVLEAATPLLQGQMKKRVSASKIIPQPLQQAYLDQVKSKIDKILQKHKETEDIPLKQERKIENEFLRSIKMCPPPLDKIEDVFSAYLREYLN